MVSTSSVLHATHDQSLQLNVDSFVGKARGALCPRKTAKTALDRNTPPRHLKIKLQARAF